MVADHFAHHLESGIKSFVAGLQGLELRNQGLDQKVLDIGFVDVDLVAARQRLFGRRI
jgi:hypothetical protein